MKLMRIAAVVPLVVAAAVAAQNQSPPVPDATIDLTTADGLAHVGAQWRIADGPIDQVEGMTKAGQPARTHDLVLKAGAADFDDSGWSVLPPQEIHKRLGGGKLSFAWYRVAITLPEMIGQTAVRDSAVVLSTTVDDYAEVWVDGKLPVTLGLSGGSVVRGWNAPSRVVLAERAEPGQVVHVAIFAANGPLSDPPANYIWLRSASVDVYKPGRLSGATDAPLRVIRKDDAIDAVLGNNPRLEKLAAGFRFTEGPVWSEVERCLLFSDPNQNVIHRYAPMTGEVSVYMAGSGFTGAAGEVDIGQFGQPGSNGLAIDREGRLTVCQHGNRRVVRIEKNGDVMVLADRFGGKRLNSPNDCVYRSDGTLFFTDPPFGLPRFHDDPRREQDHFGVYAVYNGDVKLLSTDLRGPNGLAFSPDEQFLYVTNWDEKHKVIMRYRCGADGTLSDGKVFFSMDSVPESEALDGLKIDSRGNLFASGPGGVWVIDPAGRHLGTLVCPELPANMAWATDQGVRVLYLTARTGLYRLRLE